MTKKHEATKTNRTADAVLMSTTPLTPTALASGISSTASYMNIKNLNQQVVISCEEKNKTLGNKNRRLILVIKNSFR